MSKPDVIGSFQKNRRESVRVALDEYGGVPLVDMRVTVQLTETSGIQTPTKKGLAIHVQKLPELIALLTSAHTRAAELGLLTAHGDGHGEDE